MPFEYQDRNQERIKKNLLITLERLFFIIDTQAMKQKHLQFEQLFQQLSSINFLFFLHSPSLAQSGQLVGCLSIQGAVRE